ncbi:S41 family peptidase [Lutimonas zeaxanthinifaciens]|uniref:S41 family peptidase n=1 Tax=Lutimonas zeaxanthinifaciens TaxID=3060215 RepID=UPI00265D3721|nr:S41 family peptidase [Lutimonas sp. YSD2104]WKK65991.1 S41 family peptidase [Lutimonas sp. YSD2104]
MKTFPFSIFLFSFLFTFSLNAQNTDDLWLRYPAISPDGGTIAFTYNADIYIAPSDGGQAMRLTSHPSYDAKPVWSHDGSKIAFSSDRYGNFDVFLADLTEGSIKRLTFHSANDWPSDFSIENDKIFFNSTRLDKTESLLFHDLGELYSVDLIGNLPEQILSFPAYETKINKQGDLLFEEIKGHEDQWRKHHISSVTRDIWIKKSEGTYQKLSNFKGEDRNPVFGKNNSYYYLSERSGSFNVHQSWIDQPTRDTQISSFKIHPVRYLSASNDGVLCYSFNGDIYTQQVNQDPFKINLNISGDESIMNNELLFVNGNVQEMVVSPNEKEIIFIFRGDVFATTIEGNLTRRLTNTPEQERSLHISKDGRIIVFAGERNNSWNLYTQKLNDKNEKYFSTAIDIKEELLLSNGEETFQPKFSPDGKEVAFLENRVKLRKINVTTKQVTTIHNGEKHYSYSDGDQYFEWSPDSKWLAITFFQDNYWVSEVGIIKADGTEEVINISKNGFYDSNPKWSNDGSVLYWMSNKNGMHSVAKTGPSELDIYGAFLTQGAYDKYRLPKDEFSLLPDSLDSSDKKDEGKKKGKEDDTQKKEEVKPVTIDFDNINKRIVRLSLFSTDLSDAVLGKDMKNLYYLGRATDKADLWQLNLRSKEIKSFGKFGKGGSIELDKKGENIFVLSSGKISKINLDDSETKDIDISSEMPFELSKERLFLIDHVARQVKEKFLDPDLHGVPWDSLTANYRRFVPNLNNDRDFKDILGELLGELNASHTGARYYNQNKKGDKTASFGAFYDSNHKGNGLKIDEIMKGSPLIQGEKKVVKGVIIEAIDGTAILEDKNYYPLLNRKEGVYTIVSYYNPKSGKRWKERVKPISLGEENELRYQRWIDRNRAMVHKLSNNQIGYMHVRNMSDQSYRVFLENVLGEEVNKKALVVDTRSNGGGDLVDDITTFLSGKKYMEFKSPNKIVGFESQRRWTKPSIMLIGEDNYSDAHCTPVAYKDLKIGKLVGMPVPGTCSFVWWERIQNGIVFGIPNLQVTDIKGDILENKQLEPDILIKNEFDLITNGEDQQIEAAVKELLKGLK